MNPVVHFEMPYKDKARASRFYHEALGWQMLDQGAAMGDYVVAQTTPTDAEGMIERAGAINGGLYPLSPDSPHQHPSVVVAVADIRAAMAAVTGAGGEVLGEPVEIPGVGQYVSFTDTEGNKVSLLQASR